MESSAVFAAAGDCCALLALRQLPFGLQLHALLLSIHIEHSFSLEGCTCGRIRLNAG